MIIAVIPARGGSKRIPRKNIKNFLGKPIIAYSIKAALNSGLFDKVIVSTDDKEIAEVAKKYGAEVPYIRPSNISDDFGLSSFFFLSINLINFLLSPAHCFNSLNMELYASLLVFCIRLLKAV